jgi:hypothetical protein
MAGLTVDGLIPVGVRARSVWKQGRTQPARLTLLLPLLLTPASTVSAMPQFRLQAIQQLHYDRLDPLWEYSGKVMSCTFCHVGKGGGAPWNVFGQALQKGFQINPKSRFGDVLYTVLKANGDSDGDGYPDATEIYANTLPGDAASHPEQPLAELEKAFAAAGGMAQYMTKDAPKKKGQ